MRIAIASGKGGAGKTTVTASLAAVWDRPRIAVDTDVEAPNLHLFLRPNLTQQETVSLDVPVLDQERCTACGRCRDLCQYKAIALFGKRITMFPDQCHGCGGCFLVCPEHALQCGTRELGVLEEGTVPAGGFRFLMGRSRIGEAMTPPLLRGLQRCLKRMLTEQKSETEGGDREQEADVLLDAPPGVSCPAMTVVRDADRVLLVAEPTPFGVHDFRLAHRAFVQMNKPLAVVINRAGMTAGADEEEALRDYCHDQGLPILAALPFERAAAEAYARGRLLVELSPVWRERFTALRDAILHTERLPQELCHA